MAQRTVNCGQALNTFLRTHHVLYHISRRCYFQPHYFFNRCHRPFRLFSPFILLHQNDKLSFRYLSIHLSIHLDFPPAPTLLILSRLRIWGF